MVSKTFNPISIQPFSNRIKLLEATGKIHMELSGRGENKLFAEFDTSESAGNYWALVES